MNIYGSLTAKFAAMALAFGLYNVAKGAELSLRYDDYYTFENATSVTVPGGTTAIAVDGNTIHAEGIVSTPIVVTVDGTDYEVTVGKARLNFVLIDGQSNAAGNCGKLDQLPVGPGKGVAYVWSSGAMVDVTGSFDPSRTSSIGFHPALGAEWYKLTGEKTLFYNASHSGQAIRKWASSGWTTATADAVVTILSSIDTTKYEVVRTGYYWLQGESDACPDHIADYCYYTNTDDYEAAYEVLHSAYISALTVSGLPAPYGGILTVRTRNNLLGKHSYNEYCGVRAAQQALANKYANLFMASVVTDSWTMNSTSPFSFTSDQGYSVSVDQTKNLFDNVHYKQSAYDIMGLEAADSIYKGWVQGTPATDFVLKRHDSVNTYSAGDTIVAEDNERYHGTDNTDELKAAQIVVVPTPFYGKCSNVSMALSNGQGAVTGIMGDNGYIPDYTEIAEDLTLTVAMGSVSKAYTLTRSGLAETPSNSGYYWDFTQTDKKDGLVVHAVTGDGWTANDITYNNSSFTLNSSSGLSQSNANANYFTLADTVTLSKDDPWTIEWNGVMASASIVLSYYENGTRREHVWFDGNGLMHVRGSNGSTDFYSFNMVAAAGKSATWYMIHDGHGKLTMAAYYNGTLLMNKTANAVVTADYHISNILGRYDSLTFNYHNSIRYMKIYNSAAKLPVSVAEVEIERPDMGLTPQTAVTGDHFTGTITWTPNDALFVDGGVYTASVTLTPEEGFRFIGSSSIAVSSATVSNIEVTDNSITFDAVYPAIEGKYNYFWDFTNTGNKVNNTFIAETGGDWSENTLTHQGSFSVSAANGLNSNNSYFTMQRAAMLPSNKPWTIEWQGKMGASNFVLSHPQNNTSATSGADYIFWAKNNESNVEVFRLYFVPGGNAGGNAVAKLPVEDTSGITANTVWYITHDGSGTLTMSCVDNGVRIARITKANAITKDWAFDTMLGYYALPTPQMLYSGNMKYMSIRHDGLLLNDLAISIAAPKACGPPQTAVSGNHYTGTITWSPATSAFVAGTTYTASVTLIPEEGFRFGRGFDVTTSSGAISNLSITDSSVTFDVSFGACPDLQNYFWNFQNTAAASGNRMSSETGDDWAVNGLSYKNTSDANKNITLNSTTGISNANAYFIFDDNIYLPKTEPWTIEWKGSVTASSIMLAKNTTGTPLQNNQVYIVPSYPESGYTGIFFYPKDGTCALKVPNSVAQNADTRWFIMNNGSGKLHFSVIDKDGNLYYAQPGNQASTTIEFNKLFGCYNMGSSDRRAYNGTMRYFKVYHSFNEDALPAAQIGNVKYLTLNGAIAAAETSSYNDGAPATATTIDLLRDTTGGFDVGVETSNLATYRTQNIILNLNNHTLTLGDPAVASGELKNKGIRVLAHSKLVVNNGVLDMTDSDVTRGLNTYGDCTLNNVSFVVPASSADFEYTVRNRGNLTLSGSTSIPSCGNKPALVIEPYQYPSASNVNAVLTCTSADVSVGAVSILLDPVTNNTGVPEVNISNGSFGAITESGSGLTLVGNVTGGFFDSIVPADLCAEDYVPVIEPDGNGKYTVREGVFVAKIGEVKYESVNDAVAAATKNAYWDGAPAEATTIALLTNTTGGFDVGVETGSLDTFQAQNIILDLAGYTLSLGSPAVGSAGTKNKGIRVLANSKLVVKNGTLDVTAAGITKGMNVYGECELENVAFTVPNNLEYTVRNRGKLTLTGTTTIPNSGDNPALVVEPYEYSYTANVNAEVACESANVTVGDMVVKLNAMTHHTTGAVNSGVPEMNISAGNFGTITEEGDAKTPDGGIIGGFFDSVVPENLCGDGYIPVTEADANNKYTVKQGSYVAQIGDVKYESVPAALAAVPTAIYPNTPAEATTITLLADVSTGFDIGVETGSLSTFKTQNVVFDLGGHTMTLGHPTVGSTGTQTQGIRVLAFSKLEMINGTLEVDTTAARVTLANYGELKLTDVAVGSGPNVLYTINNLGNLTLDGATSVADGTRFAIANSPYVYPDAQSVNVKLNVNSDDVVVGKILVDLDPAVHPQTHAVNNGVPEINISAGSFGTVTETGEGNTPVGNVTGGYFGSVVPEDLCADGYIPVTTQDDQGKYSVKQGTYVVEMTVNGVTTKYETINEAIANAPVDSYANGKAGQSAEKAFIRLLADTTGGFDVGVETGSLATWKIQNIEIDLDDHVLTLGKPLVGSTNTKTSGIRVLAYSELSISNGSINGLNSGALRGLQNYGDVAIKDVVFENMSGTYDTIGNFGSLVLSGETVVPNGRDSAILNSTYLYSDNSQVPVSLTVGDANVEVGKVEIDLSEYTHPQTGTVNQSNPVVAISAGTFEEISSTGSDKGLVGGVTGGWFGSIVPADLCGEGYVPTDVDPLTGLYSVKTGVYLAQITNGGVIRLSNPIPLSNGQSLTYYVSVNGEEWSAIETSTLSIPADRLPGNGLSATYEFEAVVSESGEAVAEYEIVGKVGILHVKDGACGETTIIGVPWLPFGKKTTVDSLVYLGNRDAGDEIMAYDGVMDVWRSWSLDAELKWVAVKSEVESVSASEFEVLRGQGIQLYRKTPTKPIYLVGRVPEQGDNIDSETLLPVGSPSPTWTLVAAPQASSFDLNAEGSPFADGTDDTIVLIDPVTGVNMPFTFKDEEWGRPVSSMQTINGVQFPVTIRSTDATIPAGIGFWYMNKGEGKTIRW